MTDKIFAVFKVTVFLEGKKIERDFKAKKQWIVLTNTHLTYGPTEDKNLLNGRIDISKIETLQDGPLTDQFTIIGVVEDNKGREKKREIIFDSDRQKKNFFEKLSTLKKPTLAVGLETAASVGGGGAAGAAGGPPRRPVAQAPGAMNPIPENETLSTKSRNPISSSETTEQSESNSAVPALSLHSEVPEPKPMLSESLSDIVSAERARSKNNMKKSARQATIQRPHTPLPSEPPKVKEKPYFFLWEYGTMEETDWKIYDDKAQAIIEEAWRGDKMEVRLEHGFFKADTYNVILKGLAKMVQKNNKTGNTRIVRRFPTTYPYEFTWYFDNKPKDSNVAQWEAYDKISQIAIERAFSSNQPKVKLEHGIFQNKPYSVRVSGKEKFQKNIKTKKKRNIKREPPEIVLPPKQPKPMIGHQSRLIRQNTGSYGDSQSDNVDSSEQPTHGRPIFKTRPTIKYDTPQLNKRQSYFRISNPAEFIKRWVELLKIDTTESGSEPYELDFSSFTVQYYPENYTEPMEAMGWIVKEIKIENTIQNIQYMEDLISKKGDQTFLLAHTLVQSVVIRWVADSNSWVLLQAQGDMFVNRSSIMMAEMFEPLFPYKKASKYDVARIKFDQYILGSDQKGLLSDLSAIISDLVKHFETQFNQLPQTAAIEEISDLGNDKKWKTIENLIHARLCMTLRKIFSDGYNTGFWFWENYHPWDFIKTALTTKEGFYSDSASSTLELEVSSSVAKLDLNPQILDKSQKLWGLFCEGLMNRNIASWIKTFMENKSELSRCYAPESILRSRAMDSVIELLDILTGLPFSLNYIPIQESR